MTAQQTQSTQSIRPAPSPSTTRPRASVKELKELFAAAFRDHDTITVKEIYEALATRDEPCEVPYSGSRIYVALYELGYGKEGEVFRRKFARSASCALRRVVHDPAPAPGSGIVNLETWEKIFPSPNGAVVLPEIRADFPDGEPRMRDVDLAAFLGFKEPRGIRRLIERHSDALGVRVTVPRTEKVGAATREIVEQWLTEEQVYFVCAKCGTDVATSITKQIIRVFTEVRRRGHSLAQPQATLQVEELLKLGRLLVPMIAPLLAELVKVAGSLTPPPERAPETKPRKRTVPSIAKASTDWFRTFEYLNRRGIASTSDQRKRLGTVASSLMKKEGLEPGKTMSARFGSVNTYPAHVLDRAWSIAQTGVSVEKVA